MEPQVNPSMYVKKEFLEIKNTYKDQKRQVKIQSKCYLYT